MQPAPLPFATAPRLAAVFLLYGLIAIAFLAIVVPPYQNPDEPTQFMRTVQVADGGLIGHRFSATQADGSTVASSGGPVDPGTVWASLPFNPVMFHAGTRVTRSMWEPPVRWSDRRELLGFPNTAVDPPVFYVPAAIGVLAGRASGMTVVQTLIVARLLTGAVSVAIASAAIACADGGAVWLFAILTLPMSLSVMSAVTQDALLLACSAMAAAMLLRALRWPTARIASARIGTVLATLVGMLILVGMARAPYGVLSMAPLGLSALRWRTRVMATAVAAGGVLAWAWLATAIAWVNFGSPQGADPAAQAARLFAEPWILAPLAWRTVSLLWLAYVDMFVGRLGWLDTALPASYRVVALVMLGVAAVAAMLGLRGARVGVGSQLLISACVLLSAGGLFAAEYLVWTPVGGAVVDGIQGRYFLPLALPCVALFPALGAPRLARVHGALVLLVAAFPLVTLAVVMRTIVLRYYLG